jgi:hypothetical protein
MYRQLDYFEEYQHRVASIIGPARTKKLINQGLVLITVGGNDFVNNYYLVPYSARSRQYSLQDYVKFLIVEYRKLLQVIFNVANILIFNVGYQLRGKSLTESYICCREYMISELAELL